MEAKCDFKVYIAYVVEAKGSLVSQYMMLQEWWKNGELRKLCRL